MYSPPPRLRTVPYAFVASLALAAGACGSPSKAPASPAGAAAQPAPPPPPTFRFIPSDTSYAVVNVAPPPAPYVDHVLAELAAELDGLSADIEAVRAQAELAPPERLLVAAFDTFHGRLTRAGLAELGFAPQPRVALYGVDLMPALRLELADGAAVEGLINELLTGAEMPVPRDELDGHGYWFFDIPGQGVAAIVAVVDDQLVLAAAPSAPAPLRRAHIATLLTGPARAVTHSRRFETLARTHGLGEHAQIVVDLQGAFDKLFGEPGARLPAELRGELASLSDTCQTEIRGLVATLPRLALGLQAAPGADVDLAIAIDTSHAASLRALETPVPGLGAAPDQRNLISMGIALDIDGALAFIEQRAQAVRAQPFQCEYLVELNQAADELVANLAESSQQLPAIARDPRGLYVALRDGDFSQDPPSKLQAMVILAMKRPALLVDMARAFVPQLSGLELQPNGAPAELPLPPLPEPVFDTPRVALTEGAVGVSVGATMEPELAAAMSTPPAAAGPLLRLDLDLVRVAALAVAQGDEFPEPLRAFARGQLLIDAGETGVVIRAHGTFDHASAQRAEASAAPTKRVSAR
ncbi:hypothetical protein [Haliangium sp.]|uniref:hypothetical protein n=1 Tax=Haliangium sp. TaxID=2663208 RepID=UPI003D0A4034